MVEPEIRQHFVQLPVTVDRAQKFTFGQVARHHLLRAPGHFQAAAQFRRRIREQALPQCRRHRADRIVLLLLRERLEGCQPLLRRALAEGPQLVRTQQLTQRLHVGDGGRGCRVSSLGLARLEFSHQLGQHQPAVGIGREGKLPVHHLPHHLRRRVVSHQFVPRHLQAVQCFQLRVKQRVLRDPLGMELPVDPLLEAHRLHCFYVAGARPEGQPVERLENLLVAGERLLELAAFLHALFFAVAGNSRDRCQTKYARQRKN